ncbi:hypothetical protein [Amycolatopsis thailandensis]|uniref:hypothetical protein n=1 Tax=Amycolatopsis thailandensis TaxID=589330 RepID=UPI0011783FA1|nr:hypothetical protein [Amycolatopsis thailandensis]
MVLNLDGGKTSQIEPNRSGLTVGQAPAAGPADACPSWRLGAASRPSKPEVANAQGSPEVSPT